MVSVAWGRSKRARRSVTTASAADWSWPRVWTAAASRERGTAPAVSRDRQSSGPSSRNSRPVRAAISRRSASAPASATSVRSRGRPASGTRLWGVSPPPQMVSTSRASSAAAWTVGTAYPPWLGFPSLTSITASEAGAGGSSCCSGCRCRMRSVTESQTSLAPRSCSWGISMTCPTCPPGPGVRSTAVISPLPSWANTIQPGDPTRPCTRAPGGVMTASCAWRSQLPEPRVAGSATYRLSSVNRNSLGGDSHSRTLSSKVPQSSGRPLATRYSAFSSSGSGTPRRRSHAAISSSVRLVAPRLGDRAVDEDDHPGEVLVVEARVAPLGRAEGMQAEGDPAAGDPAAESWRDRCDLRRERHATAARLSQSVRHPPDDGPLSLHGGTARVLPATESRHAPPMLTDLALQQPAGSRLPAALLLLLAQVLEQWRPGLEVIKSAGMVHADNPTRTGRDSQLGVAGIREPGVLCFISTIIDTPSALPASILSRRRRFPGPSSARQ